MKYDLCVIGGGINGVGAARDAAGRGLSVLLVEANDLGSATSSASTKLIHGGLRYLEYFDFKLVHDSLKERKTLLNSAPHIISPLQFVLPHDQNQRPAWMIRAGLFFYDHLGGRSKLPRSSRLWFSAHNYGKPLQDKYEQGFLYYDCRVDDSRLVVLNAVDAAEKGARILVNTECKKLKSRGQGWDITLLNKKTNKEYEARASMVINAAGPWVRNILESSALAPEHSHVPKVRLVKGSHIIVKRSYEGDQAYILQQEDKRIVFAIPYEDKYTLIGTTEENFEGNNPCEAQISDEETAYLCHAHNQSFNHQITANDVLWSYSGVRPLFDDGEDIVTSATRDHKLYAHNRPFPPLVSIFGGKLTTYRVVSEEAVDKILSMAKYKGAGRKWSAESVLPGGDIPDGDLEAYTEAQSLKYAWLDANIVKRYARSYGTRMDVFLNDANDVKGLGEDFGAGLYEAEIRYMVKHEFARKSEDVLWRRSKCGIHIKDNMVQNLERSLPCIIKDMGLQ